MFSTDRIEINSIRKELNYISNLVDVTFTYSASAKHVTVSYDKLAAQFGWDGVTYEWLNPIGQTYRAEVHIDPKFSSQSYLFLHEMGHVLGIEQPLNRSAPLSTTLMAWADYVNDNYSSSQVGKIVKYTHQDVLDLWAMYGVSKQYKGDIIGDARNNKLFGGTNEADASDNSEKLFGMQGADTIYGNGGDDTIYGGTGEFSPVDSADIIFGGAGNDLIYGNGGNDIFYGGGGGCNLLRVLGGEHFFLG